MIWDCVKKYGNTNQQNIYQRALASWESVHDTSSAEIYKT
jgi:hypothetical protein